MVDELLAGRALRLRDLTGIAFGQGPGPSRGCASRAASCRASRSARTLPVAGIGTLLAMAAGTQADRVVCCVDARMHEIYHAAYEKRGGNWHAVHEPSVCAPDAAPPLPGGGWLACGSGFLAYRDALEARYGAQLSAIDAACFPHARDIARLAVPLFEKGETVSAEQAAPLYLRDKVALRIDERPNR